MTTPKFPYIEKIISGGQTGVDRAGLDWAIQHQIPHGGWCPLGRSAEDGVINPLYQLQETESAGYRQRTRRNVMDSDGTLIIFQEELNGGSLLTQQIAVKLNKPCFVWSLSDTNDDSLFYKWLLQQRISIVNIAGPREGRCPGIYQAAFEVLNRWLAASVKLI